MELVWQTLFGLALFASIYSYLLYPAILACLPARVETGGGDQGELWPSVSIIVAVHNERKRIVDKLKNLLSLNPYEGKLEIIIASDASSDGTDELVREYGTRGIELIRNSARRGKEAAQGKAVAAAVGDILVFSDVATIFEQTAIVDLVAYFRNPNVGAISSTDKFLSSDGGRSGESVYIRYEMWLRHQESRVNSLIGLSGSFFAARASICKKRWLESIPSDFLAAINCMQEGKVAKIAPDVHGYYSDLSDPEYEFRRKVRTVVRGMRALASTKHVLNVRQFGLFAFSMWSHKVMRWIVPFSLLLLVTTNAVLLNTNKFFVIFMILQLLFYAVAMLGAMSKMARNFVIIRIPFYFVMTNVAIFAAAIAFFRGEEATTWTPSVR